MLERSSTGAVRPTILIAEDDPADVQLLEHSFSAAGLAGFAIIVRDGQEVKDYLERKPPFQDPARYPMPSLLLLDARMPRVSGLEVLEWLKPRPEASRIHVVLFTSGLSPQEFQRARDLGARSCLTKPHDPADWVPIIRSLQHFCSLESIDA